MSRTKAQRRPLPRLMASPPPLASIAAVAAIVAIAHAACGRAERVTLGHDAYIWQRQWTPSLDRAVIASASRVRAWRVLAAEVDSRGQIVESSPHLDVLARAARPVIPVIRISGRLPDWDENDQNDQNARTVQNDPIARDLIRRSRTLVQRWRDAGVEVTGIETDYDCPTSSLRRYASFLATLRQAHPRDVTLSITALPTWLESVRLRDVLEHVDEAVLQVHAVQHPEAGLFDRAQARAWARAWSEVSSVPFRIALPTYGSRVTWTRTGRITAIESEARTFADPASGRELFATPLDVAAFLDTLRDDRPSHLTGLVWFRVPAAEDARAWSLETWHAVMDGRALPPRSTRWSNRRDDTRGSTTSTSTIAAMSMRWSPNASRSRRGHVRSSRRGGAVCDGEGANGDRVPPRVAAPARAGAPNVDRLGRCPIEEIQVHAGS